MGAAGAMGAMGASMPEAAEWPLIFVDALNKTRGGIVLPLPVGSVLAPSGPIALDRAAPMRNWAPGVRMHLALFELIGAIDFTCSTWTAALRHRDPDATKGAIMAIELPDPASAAWGTLWSGQVQKVESWADLREDRASEILTQLTPQFMYWNAIAHLNLQLRPATLELINLALAFASMVEMRFKHALSVPRPIDWSPTIYPVIPTPAHGSLPSGHATEAFMVAHVLQRLTKAASPIIEQLQALARRTSINRTVAGVHFPVDSIAGQALGQSLGEYFVYLCNEQVLWKSRKVNATDLTANPDFTDQTDPPAGTPAAAPALVAERVVPEFWKRADAEWP
jgi:membrane-associated phospholipid phosphatase